MTKPKSRGKVQKATNNKKVNIKVKKDKPRRTTTYRDKQTRSEILNTIAGKVSLKKNIVEKVFDELSKLISGHMKKNGSGEFTIPKTGIKVRRIKKKATKARSMVSPLTGNEVLVAAKPARQVIKLTALKALKQVVEK